MAAPKLVTIFGGSGFVGRYIARRMAKDGWRVRVAVRNANLAHFERPYGVPGQVEPIFANVRDDATVRAAIRGADAVVNLVAVLNPVGKQSFGNLHVEGAGRVARIAAEEGVSALVHMSAIGADPEGLPDYARSKGEGEQAVRAQFPDAVILRPSLIFGPEDALFNRFAGMARLGPVLPIFGGNTRFQPVYVDDVAAAACKGVTGRAAPGVYELGGPDVETLRDMMHRMLGVIKRRRLVLNMPFFVGTIMGRLLDFAQFITGGIFTNRILTADQVQTLKSDNVVADTAMGFADLGITPTSMDAILDEYLYRFRPQGQYTELTDSARNVRAGGISSEF